MLIKPSLSLFLCTAAFIDGEHALSGFTKAHTLTTVSTEESSETALILLHGSRAYSQANNIQAHAEADEVAHVEAKQETDLSNSLRVLQVPARRGTIPDPLPPAPPTSPPITATPTLTHPQAPSSASPPRRSRQLRARPQPARARQVPRREPSSASPSMASPSHTRAGLSGKPGHVWEQLSSRTCWSPVETSHGRSARAGRTLSQGTSARRHAKLSSQPRRRGEPCRGEPRW
jgi:hypothetical protein